MCCPKGRKVSVHRLDAVWNRDCVYGCVSDCIIDSEVCCEVYALSLWVLRLQKVQKEIVHLCLCVKWQDEINEKFESVIEDLCCGRNEI